MTHRLTYFDTSFIVDASSFIDRRGFHMSDTEATELREQVRARYAAAASAVTNRDALAAVEACCAPVDNGSCCGGNGDVDDAFGASLYSADEQGELPIEAVVASLGCGNPMMVADLRAG
ncbi:MAG: hypothetical protein INR67_12725, partial [Jatrophihabitans endophyticus]